MGVFEADLTKPMTTEQAEEKHQCAECRSGGNCGWDCVLSETCSFHCPSCGERNWFTGNRPFNKPWEFTCVSCGDLITIRRRP